MLGSSLPSMGGGDFYEKFKKVIFIDKVFEVDYRYLSFLSIEMKKPNVTISIRSTYTR